MTKPDDKLGDLYSSFQDFTQLSSEARIKFDEYINRLKELDTMVQQDPTPAKWEIWENGVRNLYKLMLIDAFEHFKVPPPDGMEVYFAGSLAKNQATQYSDLDAFVIFRTKEDSEKSKPVFEAMNWLCYRIFEEERQFFPDPIGINPARLYGTVDQLIEKLKGHEFDLQPTIRSIYTSRPILGQFELGQELRNKLKDDPDFRHIMSATQFYKKAIHSYSAPRADQDEVDIKEHLMRPLDFILLGLREEFDIYSEDGAHLSARRTIKELREGRLVDSEIIDTLEKVFNRSMEARFKAHKSAGQEQDAIKRSEVKDLLEDVARLRQFAEQRVRLLNPPESAPERIVPQKPTRSVFRTLRTLVGVGLIIGGGALLGLGVGLALAFTVAPLGAGILAVVATAVAAAAIGITLAASAYSMFMLAKKSVSFMRNMLSENKTEIRDTPSAHTQNSPSVGHSEMILGRLGGSKPPDDPPEPKARTVASMQDEAVVVAEKEDELDASEPHISRLQ